MNENNRLEVENYLSNIDTSPLHFFAKHNFNYIDGWNLFELIYYILDFSHYHPSYRFSSSQEEIYDTDSGRRRSVIDIWRHVKFYRPDVTIFEVMSEIYKNRTQFSFYYCNVICRMTFRTINHYRDQDPSHPDEFGLYFRDWEDI